MLRKRPVSPRDAPSAALRNRDPILAVLRRVLPPRGTVIEIASGTGEHAVHFAQHLPQLTWQPSDADPRALPVIDDRRLSASDRPPPNLRPPVLLDMLDPRWPAAAGAAASFPVALVCINMIHIAPWRAAEGLFAGAEAILVPRRVLFLYGPFRQGAATARSNLAFDEELRARNAEWGVRELDAVAELAGRHRFELDDLVAMPANNLSLVFRRM